MGSNPTKHSSGEQSSTDRIERTAAAVVRKLSDEESSRTGTRRQITPAPEPHRPREFAPHELPCALHSANLDRIEETLRDHSARHREAEVALAEGRTEFAVLRKDIHGATAALTDLAQRVSAMIASRPSAVEKIQDALIHWGVPLVGGGILWAVVQSKAHP